MARKPSPKLPKGVVLLISRPMSTYASLGRAISELSQPGGIIRMSVISGKGFPGQVMHSLSTSLGSRCYAVSTSDHCDTVIWPRDYSDLAWALDRCYRESCRRAGLPIPPPDRSRWTT